MFTSLEEVDDADDDDLCDMVREAEAKSSWCRWCRCSCWWMVCGQTRKLSDLNGDGGELISMKEKDSADELCSIPRKATWSSKHLNQPSIAR